MAFTLTSAAATPSAPPHGRRRPVILTTDCGTDMDDQWALAHLALSPEIKLLGVVTTHAPNLPAPAAEASARSAREVLAGIPQTRSVRSVRVLAGSGVPLKEPGKPLGNAGVDFIIENSRGFSARDRLTVLTIGAATDVASALLADPAVQDRVEVVAMGYRTWPEGGDDWNVKNDVKAWQAILASRAPVTIGAAQVCLRDLTLSRERSDLLFRGHGNGGDYIASIMTDWFDRNGSICKAVTGNPGLWPVWDSVTVAHLLGLAQWEEHPRPALADDMRFTLRSTTESAAPFRWITRVDSDRLWEDFVRKLDAANQE